MLKTLKQTSLCFLAFLWGEAASAVLVMKPEEVRETVISSQGLTRLSVKGEIIQDIFVSPLMRGEMALSDAIQLHKSGHVFIAPQGLKEPFYVTLMTQKGHVQDLKIIPSSSQSQPLILELPKNPKETPVLSQRKALEVSLLAALQGIRPQGFITSPLTNPLPHSLGTLLITQKAIYTSKDHVLRVFELENTSSKDLALLPEMFLGAEDVAVVFEHATLQEGEKTLMAILTSPQPLFLNQGRVTAAPLSSRNCAGHRHMKALPSAKTRPLKKRAPSTSQR